jgi:hypothetical protein
MNIVRSRVCFVSAQLVTSVRQVFRLIQSTLDGERSCSGDGAVCARASRHSNTSAAIRAAKSSLATRASLLRSVSRLSSRFGIAGLR